MRRSVLAAGLAGLGLVAAAASAGAERAGGHQQVVHRPPPMVEVPGGQFIMGLTELAQTDVLTWCAQSLSDEACAALQDDFLHLHDRVVWVDRFLIDRDEVTAGDYRRCIAAGACLMDPLVSSDPRYIRDELPLVNVTWYEARTYCTWRGGRLPTEAEWERAAVGDGIVGDNPSRVPRGNEHNHGRGISDLLRKLMQQRRDPRSTSIADFDRYLQPDDSDGAMYLAPPGSYPWTLGPFGTRDQAGNVAEWVEDAVVGPDAAGYDGLPDSNPVREPRADEARVVRGGSWAEPVWVARPDLRDPFTSAFTPGSRLQWVGFRCAATPR